MSNGSWRNKTTGAPSLNPFVGFKGGIPRISIPTVAYPTLCKERKGWGTRRFVALATVSKQSTVAIPVNYTRL